MVGFSLWAYRKTANSELEIRDNCDDNCGGRLDSNGALACKEEPLHSWVPGSNTNWTDSNSNNSAWIQKQLNPSQFKIVVSDVIQEPLQMRLLIYDSYTRLLFKKV